MNNIVKQLTLKNDLKFYDAIGLRLNELLDKDVCQLQPQLTSRSKIYQPNNYEISYGFKVAEYEDLILYIKDNVYDGITLEIIKWGPGKVKEKIEKKKLQTFKAIPESILELLEKITATVNYSEIINNLFSKDMECESTLAMGVSPF